MTESEVIWKHPSATLSLPRGEVHVWRASLQREAAQIEKLFRILSEEEKTRAERFLSREHRGRFIVARGVLRRLLGDYLGAAPEELRFAYGIHGKPELAGQHSGLRFNLSHSHLLALYAVVRCREVGVDVEYPRPGTAVEQIARRFFADVEVDALQSLPQALRRDGFFNCWTRKEAYLKARGAGITIGLDSFAVSLKPGEEAVLLGCEEDPKEVIRWRLAALHPGSGYAAALCVEGDDWRLRCWQWPD